MLASIPLASLHVDRSISLRKSNCQTDIRRYADAIQAGDVLPAVDVCVDDNHEYWLADGFLRYDAHVLAGATEIIVSVHAGGVRGAHILACGANDLHGRQRTVAEKRAAVERLLTDAEWKTWSDHLIAENCRVSHTFVAKMRARLEAGVSERQPRSGRDGRPVKPRPARSSRSLLPAETSAAQQGRRQTPAGESVFIRAIPTRPGLCELPRLPARAGLPPVDPERARAAIDPLSEIRDLLLAARGRLIEVQALVPDPNCQTIADGMDHSLVHLLPWLERVDPYFEEEGRPPQLPRVLEAAANLTAEQEHLRQAMAAQGVEQAEPVKAPMTRPAADARAQPPAASEPPAAGGPSICKSMWAGSAEVAPPRAPASRQMTPAARGAVEPLAGLAGPSAAPAPSVVSARSVVTARSRPRAPTPISLQMPEWATAEMAQASRACLSGDRDALFQAMTEQQAAFRASCGAPSLETLPNFGASAAAPGAG